MKLTHRQPLVHRPHRGFSLLETSTAISVLLALSLALVALLQQQITFMNITKRQAFLADEAPKIGSLLARVLNQADHYFVYDSKDSAMSGGDPVLAGGRAVRLFFKTATQTSEQRILAAEDAGDGTELRFYTLHADGSQTSWTVCRKLAGASFRCDEGILVATLNGPNGEEISYCGGGR